MRPTQAMAAVAGVWVAFGFSVARGADLGSPVPMPAQKCVTCGFDCGCEVCKCPQVSKGDDATARLLREIEAKFAEIKPREATDADARMRAAGWTPQPDGSWERPIPTKAAPVYAAPVTYAPVYYPVRRVAYRVAGDCANGQCGRP